MALAQPAPARLRHELKKSRSVVGDGIDDKHYTHV
jgi:hypothetical protein